MSSAIPADWPQPSCLKTHEDVLNALKIYNGLESNADATLSDLLSQQTSLIALLDNVDAIAPIISHIQIEAQELHVRIDNTAQVAERISSKVRQLDVEQSRVKESIDVLQSVQDLKTSILGVHLAYEKQDWEAATRNMAKALSIDPKIVQSDFAEAVIPTSDLPLPPSQTIEEYRTKMLHTFLEHFEKASKDRDEASLSRYFKLFPLINHSDKGLASYSHFIATLLPSPSKASSTTALQSPMHFALALTGLFEQTALIIANHQSVIEKYYGRSDFLLGVIKPLSTEYSRLALSILSQWEEERRIDRRLLDVKSYRFHFLNSLTNATLPPPSSSSAMTVTISGSPFPSVPSNLNMRALNASFRSAVSQGSSAAGSPAIQQNGPEDELADTKDIDAILNEMSQMSGRWQLFRKFLYARLTDEEVEEEDEKVLADDEEIPAVKPSASLEDAQAMEIIEASTFQSDLQAQLKHYVTLEAYYFKCAIEKVHSLDTPDLSARPVTTSALDDTFFIFKKVLGRVLGTADFQVLISTSHALRSCLERDWALIFRKRMDMAASSMQVQQSYKIEDQKKEREAKALYVAYLNNLDMGSDYLNRLTQAVLDDGTASSGFFRDVELAEATQAIKSLSGAEDSFRSTMRSGIDQLFNQLIRPRLRPLILECYKDVSYVLDEDGFAEASESDVIRKRFTRAWEDLTASYRTLMTEGNYRILFGLCVSILVRPWEASIKSLRFTELGALRFDRDLRNVISFLSSQTPLGAASLRDAFTRLQQISTLLNATQEDANDLIGSSGWRLSMTDMNAYLALRI